jgi:hypothetical protein
MATTVPAELKRIHSTDRTVNQLQENTRTALTSQSEAIAGCLQAQQVIDGVSFPTPGVDVVVPHSLGRAPVGYLMVQANAPAAVYTSPTTNPSPTSQLILRSSATGAVTADLLVF